MGKGHIRLMGGVIPTVNCQLRTMKANDLRVLELFSLGRRLVYPDTELNHGTKRLLNYDGLNQDEVFAQALRIPLKKLL